MIWDVLCGVEALHELARPKGVVLRAQGDLAVVALFAAVLDPRIVRIESVDLLVSLDRPTNPDGRTDIVEVPHALRFTDIDELRRRVTVTDLIAG